MGPGTPHHEHDADLVRAIDSASDGMLCIAEDGTVLYANSSAWHLLGLAENPVGQHYSVFRTPSLVDRITHCIQPAARCQSTPVTILVDDKTLSVHSWHAGTMPRLLAMSLRDESAIVHGHKRVEAVLNATTDGLVVLSLVSEVTFVNPAAETILGSPAKQLIGSPLQEPELAWVCDTTCEDEEREVEIERDGVRRLVTVHVSPIIDSDGGVTGRVISLRDITTESEIAQMKNEFVSTVSHELRTPLTSIKGYVDLILDGDAGEINDIQREFLSIVKENSDRLVDLINDMLDISRIESGASTSRWSRTRSKTSSKERSIHFARCSPKAAAPSTSAYPRTCRRSWPTEIESGRCSSTSSAMRSSTRRRAALCSSRHRRTAAR